MENGGLYMFLIGMLQGKNQIRKWKSFVALLLNYMYLHQTSIGSKDKLYSFLHMQQVLEYNLLSIIYF